MVVGVGEVVLAAVALDASIVKAERRRRRTDCMAAVVIRSTIHRNGGR